MDLFSNATDDQIALMGCAAALLFSGGLMYVSFFIGRGRSESSNDVPAVALQARRASSDEARDRRAA